LVAKLQGPSALPKERSPNEERRNAGEWHPVKGSDRGFEDAGALAQVLSPSLSAGCKKAR
jgi:hypothetical protein